jgi:hypothetical protein
MNSKNVDGKRLRSIRVLSTFLFGLLVASLALLAPSRMGNTAPAGPAAAQENKADAGPSYEETRNWVISKLQETAGGSEWIAGGRHTFTYDGLSMDACVLRYSLHETAEAFWLPGGVQVPESRTDVDVSVPLDHLESAWTSDYLFILGTDSRKIFISGRYTVNGDSFSGQGYVQKNCPDSVNAGVYPISGTMVLRKPQSDWQNLVPRIIKALEHSSELCKAKAPKSNEPF